MKQKSQILLCQLIFYHFNHFSTTINLWSEDFTNVFIKNFFIGVKLDDFYISAFDLESDWNIKVYSVII